MKIKTFFFILCCLIVSFVLFFVNKKESTENNTVSLVTTSPSVFKDERKVVNVTDETGEKRQLRMAVVDTKDKGVYLSKTDWISNYSQVLDGHYYYLRCANDGYGYTVYRDQGDKVGSFVMPWSEEGNDEFYELEGFVKYGKKFYVLMSHFSYKEGDSEELGYLDTEKINMEQFNMEWTEPVAITDVTEDHMMDDKNIVFCNIYSNSFYFDSRSVWQKWEERPGTSIKYDITGECSREQLSVPVNLTKAKPYLTYMDGKIYYGVSSGNKVTLYSYDMLTKTEEEIFFYEQKSKYSSNNVFISIDEKNIYCQDYLIPRAGGKMLPVFRNAKKNKNGIVNYTYNNKYIFYIDKKKCIVLTKRLRRILLSVSAMLSGSTVPRIVFILE